MALIRLRFARPASLALACLCLSWLAVLACVPARAETPHGAWELAPRLADIPLDGAEDISLAARREEAFVDLPFAVTLGDARYEALVVGTGFLHLLGGLPPEGDPESGAHLPMPSLGPRLDVLPDARLHLAPSGRTLLVVRQDMVVIRWVALQLPGVRGAAIVEMVVEPGLITVQYLHVPPGFVSGPSPSARAFRLFDDPLGAISSPLDAPPRPMAAGAPPAGCEPEAGEWCDFTGPQCTATAGNPGPGGVATPCSQRQGSLWRFYEQEFCLDCPYRFYILVECGREMHLPTWDMESLDLEITNMLTGEKPDLRCINDTALGLGPTRDWRNPPNCGAAKPGPWWSPPLDVTNNAGPGHVSFSDSTPLDGNCTTRFDVSCALLPASGVADVVVYGEEQTIDCFIADPAGLCGIYRVDIISGGNGWELFANCDGTNTPQFDIFVDCTEAWDAYNPLPEIAIANVSATGDCWTYAVQFDVQNIGCTDEPSDVPVRITSACGDVLDLIVPGPIPALGHVTYTQPMTLSCPDGVITFTVDPDDFLLECTETSSAAACQAEEGVDTLEALVTCCPFVGAGSDKVACAGVAVALSDASSQFADVFNWDDGGAGGSFIPSAGVRNPSYVPPMPSPPAITLTIRATYSGSGCFREDSLLLSVNPSPAVDGGPPVAACVGAPVSLSGAVGDFADQFTWSDGGAGGVFLPSAFVLAPQYSNPAPGSHVLTISGLDVATGCAGTDTVTVTFNPSPEPDAGVDKQACACEPVPLVDALGGTAGLTWSDGGAGGTFLPSADATNPVYLNPGAGLVTLSLVALDGITGCLGTDQVVIEFVDCPEADAGDPKETCLGEEATLFDAVGGSASEYVWIDSLAGGTFSPSAGTLNPSYSNPVLGPHELRLFATDRGATGDILYEHDFETPVGPEWSSTATELTPQGGRRFLGSFANETVTLSLSGLPAHEQVSICLDLFVLGGWDGHVGAPPDVGPDLFDMRVVGGAQLVHASFAQAAPFLQSHPEAYQDALGSASPAHPAREGADEEDTLGYPLAEGGDAVYRLAFTLRHSASDLQLEFSGSGLSGFEAWGIDELQVSSGSCRACTARDSVIVTVNPPPEVDAGAPKQACAGTPIPLDDASPGVADDHHWSDGGAGGSFEPNSRVLAPSYTNARAGSYLLTYTGTAGATGCLASDTVQVTVNPAPLVSAGADDTGCAGEPIPIDDAFAASGTNVSWSDGGAGGTFSPSADVLEPEYSHPVPGTYVLTLTATRLSTGCTASDDSMVTVLAAPSVDAGPDLEGCSGPVLLSGASTSGASVLWSDGGASGSFSPSASVLAPTYTNVAGSYTLLLRATSPEGCVAEDTRQVIVFPNPAVSAGSDVEACVAQDVALAGATSSADTFSWSDAGAGGTFTPSAFVLNPSYRHPARGTYTLTLTATVAATGCSSADILLVTVRDPPIAAFNAPASACEDTPVCFDNVSVDGVGWAWSFGDGAGGGSAQFEPCYVYSEPGTYTVTLTASNACGGDAEQRQIAVNPKPVASFTWSTQGGRFCKDKAINFTSTATNAPTSWQWDFGDGNVSTAQNPVHSYASDGVFIVSLVACNGCGCSPPRYEALEIAATCQSNCEANSNQVDCTGVVGNVASNTCTDHGNFNTSSYPCAPGLSYTGLNKTYDLNFAAGSNFIIRLTETVPEPNGYDLDLMISDSCNPPSCVAWGDTEVYYDDRTAANDDFWLIVDGRDGTCGPYTLTIECLSPADTALCSPPVFDGIVSAEDQDECSIPGILVSWDEVADWGTDAQGTACDEGHFEIWRAPVSSPADEIQVGTAPTMATSFLDVATVPRREYRYRVNAVNHCCGEPALTGGTDDALDDFGNAIDMDAGSGGIITCDAPEIQLLGTASGGTGSGFDYLWSPAAGLSDPMISNPVATLGATYTLTVTDRGDACTSFDSVVVVGDALPPLVSAGPDRVITCATSVVVLQGSAIGGNSSEGYAYSWSPASGVSNPASPTPTTTTPGTYTLTVEAIATGCTSTDTVTVTASLVPPVASAGPNAELTCSTASVTLQGSASGGDGSAGWAYSWSPAAAVSDAASPTPQTSESGTFTLTVIDLATGCSDTDVVVVLRNDAPPLADAGPDFSLDCSAGPVTLRGSAFGGDGSLGYAFAWSPADAVSDASAPEPVTSVPGTYVLTVTDLATGCTGTDSATVSADPGAPQANAGPDGAITCLSATAALTGSATGGDGSSGYFYSWSPADDVADPASPATSTSVPGVYTLRVTSVADGCVGIDTMLVEDLRGAPVTSAGPDLLLSCASASVVLQGQASGSDGRDGYAWSWTPPGPLSDPASATPSTSTPGTYTLTATDIFTGCSSSDSVSVTTDTTPPLADAGPDRVVTCSSPSAMLLGGASGGNGSLGYTFAWEPAGDVSDPSSATPSTTLPGAYVLTVTDLANGCSDTDTVIVTQDAAAPTASAGPDALLDCGVGSVPLAGSASGGNGSSGYAFHWEPAANVSAPDAPSTTATAAGTYTLTVTAVATGCTSSDTVLVTSAGGPVADAGPDDRITCQSGIASLMGQATGGNGSQGYLASWSPVAGVASPGAFSTTTSIPGTYTLTVTDIATGCASFDQVIIEDATIPPEADAGPDGMLTCASATCVLQGIATGGDGSLGFEFAWTPVDGLSDPASQSPTASQPGTYVVTITDVATGCVAVDSVNVTDGQAAPFVTAGSDQARTCAFPVAVLAGAASGGGALGFTYEWSPVDGLSDPFSPTTSASQAGTFTLTVTDLGSGCVGSDVVVVVDDFAPPVANAGSDGTATCAAPLVQLTGSASGGNASLGYTFAWEPAGDVSNPVSATPVGLAPGTYTLTVTSRASGCSASDTVVVADGTQPPVPSAGPDRGLDCDSPSVLLEGSASGGDASLGYTYAWEPSGEVSDPASPTTTTSTPGIYSLTVTSVATGCSATDSVSVSQDVAVPFASAGPDRRIDCDTPMATLTGLATGGNGSLGYSFAWSPAGDVTAPSSAVTSTGVPGTYTLTVTALASGCFDTDVVIVTLDGAEPLADAGPDASLGCDGNPVTLAGSASGGNGGQGYSYSWSPSAAVTSPNTAITQTSLAGTYTLTVTDLANGCTSTDVVLVSSDAATPVASAGADLQLDCDTPTVTLMGSAAGGDDSQGYAYHWEPSSLVSNSSLPEPLTSTAGAYTLTVTSIASGCESSDVVVVTRDVRQPTANAGPDRVLDCDTPAVTLSGSATGGDATSGYLYSWSPALGLSDPAAQSPTATVPGNYTLTVTTVATGCTDIDTVLVVEDVAPPMAEAGPDRHLDCNTMSVLLDGAASGGNGSLGYSYAWSPAGGVSDPSSPTPTVSTPGSFTLTVTDLANGCVASDIVMVTQDITAPVADAGPDAVLDCRNASVPLTASASGGNGTAGYAFHWEPSGAVSDPGAASTDALASGTFTVTVTDLANGCTSTDSVEVTSSEVPPDAEAGPQGRVTCLDATADLVGSASGGDGSLGYLTTWSPTTGVADPSAPVTTTTVPGTYTLLVEDIATGCRSADTVVVIDDTVPPVAEAGAALVITCSSPSVTLQGSASGGNDGAGRTWAWEPAGDVSDPASPTPTTSQPGAYTLTVTDVSTGCFAEDTVIVTIDQDAPVAEAGPDRPLGCLGAATLQGEASGGNGGAGYSFRWEPAGSVSNPDIAQPQALVTGVFTLTVTDLANGCTASDVMNVVADATPPVADAGGDAVLTCAQPSVTLAGAATGGNGSDGYAYAWEPAAGVEDPGSATTATSLAGTYTLTVTDLANGCTDTDTVIVTSDVASPTASAGPDVVTDCAATNATLTGTASGGNGSLGYSFHWEPAGAVTAPDAAITQATATGTFTLTVTDLSNGCTDTDVVEVTSNVDPPVANAGPDGIVRCDRPANLSGSASGGDGRLGYTAAWTPVAGVANPSAFVTTTTLPGTYTLTVTDVFTGCRGADSVEITDDARVPVAEAGPDANISCVSGAAQLQGSGSGGNGSQGYIFRWEPAATVVNPNAAITSATAAGTYTLTVTDRATGCSSQDTMEVTATSVAPTASAGADRLLSCVFTFVTLQGSASGGDGSAGYEYRWEPAASVSDPDIATPITFVPTTFTLTVTDVATGCKATDTVTVTRDIRNPIADAGPNGGISCTRPVATLRGSGRGGNGSLGYSFAWTPTAGVADPTAGFTTTTVPGTYTLTVTDLANGCTSVDTVTIRDEGAPPQVSAGPDLVITCAVAGVVLQGSATGGDGSLGYAYSWSPPGGLSNPNIATPTALNGGTYTLRVTDVATGCEVSDSATVTVDRREPVAEAGPPRTLTCGQPAVQLDGLASGGNGTLGYSYAWEPAGQVSDPLAAVTQAFAQGTYTLTVVDLFNGCSATDTVLVSADATLPEADAGSDQVVSCASPQATLTGSASGGDGSLGYDHLWSPAGEVADPTSPTTTTSTPGLYTLTITDRATGCQASDIVRVDAGSAPTPVEPSALDQRPAATPLRVTKGAGAELVATWEDVGAFEYRLYEGAIPIVAGALDHAPRGCGLAAPTHRWTPPAGARYVIGIAANCDGAESSYGRSSRGIARPDGMGASGSACP